MLFSEVLWVISETVTTAVYNGRGGADVVSGMSAGWAIVNLLRVLWRHQHGNLRHHWQNAGKRAIG